jgi:hypothetical protein
MSNNPDEQEQQVVIIGPDGQPIGAVPASALTMGAPAPAQQGEDGEEPDERALTDLVEQPSKVLRIAQAQLVGWLEGLFHGLQTAIYAQQMAARAQFEQMRKGLAHGMLPPGHGDADLPQDDAHPRQADSGGMYL